MPSQSPLLPSTTPVAPSVSSLFLKLHPSYPASCLLLALLFLSFSLPFLSNSPSIKSSHILDSSPPTCEQNLSDARLNATLSTAMGIKYYPPGRLLFAAFPKCGSTSLFRQLYRLHFGYHWPSTCTSYVQNARDPCWQGNLVFLNDLPRSTARHLLCAPQVQRVAVWRDPYLRLLSAWRSKYACDADAHSWLVGSRDRAMYVPELREHAGMPDGDKLCMSLDEFAEALERVRKRGNHGKANLHVRPVAYVQGVTWDVVMTTGLWEGWERVVERIGTRGSIPKRVPWMHRTGGEEEVQVEKEAERKLRAFAALSEARPVEGKTRD